MTKSKLGDKDWIDVERAMQRSVRNRGTEQDQELCLRAYRNNPERYSKLSRQVRAEAFEEEKAKWR